MTQQLFQLFTRAGTGWVMLLLLALSVASIAIILERLVFFARHGHEVKDLVQLLATGRLDEARVRAGGARGLQAAVARAALAAAAGGPHAVEQAAACAVAQERLAYERSLSFLGTLGNNAPFLGLFGTVIGIIKAFSDLAVGSAHAAAAAAVMAGISEALVATAVGILVALPAVVAHNGFQRWLRTLVCRADAVTHALRSHLAAADHRAAAARGEAA